jgi:DNA-binding ferritin-like protein
MPKAKAGPAPLHTPSDLKPNAVRDLSGALNILLADMFALYLKTKNFHWHMSGPHFRDYHLLLDEHGDQIFATTDAIAERVRKIGGTTLHSIGHIGRLQRVTDNDADFVTPMDMLAELGSESADLDKPSKYSDVPILIRPDHPCSIDAPQTADHVLHRPSRQSGANTRWSHRVRKLPRASGT